MTWFLNMCFLLIDILKLYNLMYRKVSVLHNKFKQVRWNIKSQSMSNYQQDLSNLVYVKFCICRILYMSNFTMSYFEFHHILPFLCVEKFIICSILLFKAVCKNSSKCWFCAISFFQSIPGKLKSPTSIELSGALSKTNYFTMRNVFIN